LARFVALAAIVTLVPLPVLAGGASQPAKAPGLRASVARLGVLARPATPRAPTVRLKQAGGADLRSPSFFKRPVGVVVLATLAVGAGYAIYSTQHDRISSAGKK
jgi:hypothetical protein